MTMDWSRIIDQQAEESRKREVIEAEHLKASFPAFESQLATRGHEDLLDLYLEWHAPRHSTVITMERVVYAEACKKEILRRMNED